MAGVVQPIHALCSAGLVSCLALGGPGENRSDREANQSLTANFCGHVSPLAPIRTVCDIPWNPPPKYHHNANHSHPSKPGRISIKLRVYISQVSLEAFSFYSCALSTFSLEHLLMNVYYFTYNSVFKHQK